MNIKDFNPNIHRLLSQMLRLRSNRVAPLIHDASISADFLPAVVQRLRDENLSLRQTLHEKEVRIAALEHDKLIRDSGEVHGPRVVHMREGSVEEDRCNMVISEISRLSEELEITNKALGESIASLSPPITPVEIKLKMTHDMNIRGLENVHWRISHLNGLVGQNRSLVFALIRRNEPITPKKVRNYRTDCIIRVTVGEPVPPSRDLPSPVGVWNGDDNACAGFEVSSSLPGHGFFRV